MNDITVDKKELITKLQANRDAHEAIFNDAVTGAGSGNSDRVLSGNSGRSRQALRSRSTRAKRQPSASPGRGRSDRSHDPA